MQFHPILCMCKATPIDGRWKNWYWSFFTNLRNISKFSILKFQGYSEQLLYFIKNLSKRHLSLKILKDFTPLVCKNTLIDGVYSKVLQIIPSSQNLSSKLKLISVPNYPAWRYLDKIMKQLFCSAWYDRSWIVIKSFVCFLTTCLFGWWREGWREAGNNIHNNLVFWVTQIDVY